VAGARDAVAEERGPRGPHVPVSADRECGETDDGLGHDDDE
jgi:hypothetical protein